MLSVVNMFGMSLVFFRSAKQNTGILLCKNRFEENNNNNKEYNIPIIYI